MVLKGNLIFFTGSDFSNRQTIFATPANSTHYSVYYLVGEWDTNLGVHLQWFIASRLFNRILHIFR